MKAPKFKLALVALFAVFLIPQTSDAATAVAVTDNTGLFLIKFDFIAGKEDYLIPIGAVEGLAFGSESRFAGYDIFSGDEKAETDMSAGITLSKQEIVDNFYYRIKAGERASFTTVVLATVPENMTVTQYKAMLTHMPYMNGDTKTEVAENRLEDFKSDSIILNKELHGDSVKVLMK